MQPEVRHERGRIGGIQLVSRECTSGSTVLPGGLRRGRSTPNHPPKANDAALVKQLTGKGAEIGEAKRTYDAYQKALATLKDKPDDADAHLATLGHRG